MKDGLEGLGAGISAEQLPLLASAMGEAGALMADDAAQFDVALDALVRGLDASFRERELLA